MASTTDLLFILHLLNILFWAIAFCFYILFDSYVQVSNYLQPNDDFPHMIDHIKLMIGGFVICCLILGHFYVFFGRPSDLDQYYGVLFCCVLLEIIVIFPLSNHMNDLVDFFGRGLKSEMKLYGQGNVVVVRDVDFIQEKLHCCGYNNYEDWKNLTLAVPQSCCKSSTCDTKNSTDIFTTGCYEEVHKVRRSIMLIDGPQSLIFVLLQFGVMSSFGAVAERIRKEAQSELCELRIKLKNCEKGEISRMAAMRSLAVILHISHLLFWAIAFCFYILFVSYVQLSNYLQANDDFPHIIDDIKIVFGMYIIECLIAGQLCVFLARPHLLDYSSGFLSCCVLLEFVLFCSLTIHMNDLVGFFERGLESNMKLYGQGNVVVVRDLDFIQEKLHCCGYNNYEDWKNLTLAVPQSCCKSSTCDTKNSTDIFTTGCYEELHKVKRSIMLNVGPPSLIFLLLQIVMMQMFSTVAKKFRKEAQSEPRSELGVLERKLRKRTQLIEDNKKLLAQIDRNIKVINLQLNLLK